MRGEDDSLLEEPPERSLASTGGDEEVKGQAAEGASSSSTLPALTGKAGAGHDGQGEGANGAGAGGIQEESGGSKSGSMPPLSPDDSPQEAEETIRSLQAGQSGIEEMQAQVCRGVRLRLSRDSR